MYRRCDREPLQSIRFVLLVTEMFTELGYRGLAADFFEKVAHSAYGIVRPLFFEQAAQEYLML